ncbi:MAG: hypothetical protein IT378_25515 [Sandaracinaceae bacterium]|nr:hypothetical protein [Sandaracinaceae bacterium]
MDLDERLGKIATGISVSDALEAYLEDLEAKPRDPAAAARQELLAILEIMFLMAAVDGEVAADELAQLRQSLEALSDPSDPTRPELGALLAELSRKLAEDGWAARLADAASRVQSPESRAFAFRLAAGVAFVDDFVAHAEAAAIDALSQALSLSKEEAQELLREVHATLFGGSSP